MGVIFYIEKTIVTKTKTPPQFDPAIYSKIILNDLVIYSVYYLRKQGTGIASEDIIATCFALFPQRFSLRKYPQYPDSGIVSRRWSDCKSRGYLRGNANSGFQITAKGIKRAEKVEKLLGKPMKPVRKTEKSVVASAPAASAETVHPELKAHAKKYIHSIETSDAYKHYRKNLPLNEFDFRSLLLCTMESPPTTLARNLDQFKEYVNIHDRTDLLSFLEFCGEKFSSLLGVVSQQAEKKIINKK